MDGTGKRHEAAVVAGIVALGLLIGFAHSSPPAVVSAAAAETEFSAERALDPLRAITREPHPIGSAGHARVRDDLVERLRKLGLDPQIQETTAILQPALIAARVFNIVAKIEGSASTGALVLMAHYDAVPFSFGAGDDGAAVAAILETVRALGAGPGLRNDLIVLLTDAEEVGLLGAVAFVQQHPWAQEVSIVLNFEGRGNKGVSTLFETSEGNGRLIREVASSVPHPIGNSLSYEVYKLLPNDTDVSVFKRGDGVAALNFGFIGGHTHYHAPIDTFERLDRRSLQHHGDTMLALARRFGQLDLADLSAPDRVYFDLPWLGLVHYSVGAARLLAIGSALGLLLLLVAGVRAGEIRVGGVLIGLAAAAAAVGIGPALAHWGWARVEALHPGYASILQGDTYNSAWYVGAFATFVVAIAMASYATALRWASVTSLMIVPLVATLGLVLAAVWQMPGASYLPQVPLAFALGAVWVSRRGEPGVARAVAVAVLAVPAVVLVAPMTLFLVDALTLRLMGALLVVPALTVSLLVPAIAVLARWSRWKPVAVVMGASLALLSVAEARSGFDEVAKKPDSMLYVLDANTGEALWASRDPEVDEWTRQFLGPAPSRSSIEPFWVWGSREVMTRSAPSWDVLAPEAEVLEDATESGERGVTLRFLSPRGAANIGLFAPGEPEILRVELAGTPLRPTAGSVFELGRGGRLIGFYALPPEGIELRIVVPAGSPIQLTLIDQSYGLPTLDGFPPDPRPPHLMSKPFIVNEMALVLHSIEF